MKSKISAYMDGELRVEESSGPLAALREHAEAREAWNTYHLISDAMRDTRLLSGGFSARVAAKLADEPTLMASQRPAPRAPLWAPRWTLTAAAGVAAVALVGGMFFTLLQGPEPASQVAQAPRQVAPAKNAAQVLPPAAQVPPPAMAHDYLLAHQGYSPRNSLQGMAPYVRMVSSQAGAGKP